MSEVFYPHAGPAIRNALCLAAERCRFAGEDRGRFDGLTLALEIMLCSADITVAPGIAWPHLIPQVSMDHARWLLGANAHRLLD